uniref:Uncharacterized protein n=1 Tax=Cacopsylla melanoneura TaxID=428564 RepID=A0A8D9AKG6_9HEMI
MKPCLNLQVRTASLIDYSKKSSNIVSKFFTKLSKFQQFFPSLFKISVTSSQETLQNGVPSDTGLDVLEGTTSFSMIDDGLLDDGGVIKSSFLFGVLPKSPSPSLLILSTSELSSGVRFSLFFLLAFSKSEALSSGVPSDTGFFFFFFLI